MINHADVLGHVVWRAAPEGGAEVARFHVEAVTTGGLDGKMRGIHTGPRMTAEGATVTTVTIDVHAAAVEAVHERHLGAAANLATRRAALHQLEKSDVETAPALVPEADMVVIGLPLAAATVLALGVRIILIATYLVEQPRPPVPAPESVKIAGTASVMIADLVGVMIAAIVDAVTGPETMIAGMVEENGAADAKNPIATNLVVAVQMRVIKRETATGSPENAAGSGVVTGVVIEAVIETGAGGQGVAQEAAAGTDGVDAGD